MRQRLDIADVEARTKIRAKYLRALENEEFSMLPGPTFVKTFLRTYAEMLGLDPHVLVEEYRAGFEREDEMEAPLGPPAVAGRDRRHGPRIGPGSLILLVLVGIVAALVAIGLASDDDGGGDEASAPETTRSETRATTPAEPPPPKRVSLRVTPGLAHVHMRGPGRGHAGRLREHDRRRADVPRQANPREPGQARRAAPHERQAGARDTGPGSGRLCLHAAREPRAPGRRAPLCVVS